MQPQPRDPWNDSFDNEFGLRGVYEVMERLGPSVPVDISAEVKSFIHKTILQDREKTVAVLRENLYKLNFSDEPFTKKVSEECGRTGWSLGVRDTTIILHAFDTASKLLTPAREEKG